LQYDVVVANILANTLIDLSSELYAITKPGGKLIASGIINHRADDVVKGIVSAGYTFDDQRVSGEWVAQIYTR
jgi:ribosomal protein L11 methyltransferase